MNEKSPEQIPQQEFKAPTNPKEEVEQVEKTYKKLFPETGGYSDAERKSRIVDRGAHGSYPQYPETKPADDGPEQQKKAA